jgi:hypothetical protein
MNMAKNKTNFWIQGTKANKGALHKQLGYQKDTRLPDGLLKRIVDTPIGNKIRVKGESRINTRLLKSRANFALNTRKNR